MVVAVGAHVGGEGDASAAEVDDGLLAAPAAEDEPYGGQELHGGQGGDHVVLGRLEAAVGAAGPLCILQPRLQLLQLPHPACPRSIPDECLTALSCVSVLKRELRGRSSHRMYDMCFK